VNGHPASSADVLVIGAGPAGLVTARSVASSGRRVVVVDTEPAERNPRGSALLPPVHLARASSIGLDLGGHRVTHVRFTNGDDTSSVAWPSHPEHPGHGTIVDRRTLEGELAAAAVDAGAELWFEHEATDPIVDRGFVRGAHLSTADGTRFEARAEYVVVADGANSRFGRALGSFRDPNFPYANAHHVEYRSAIHDATEVELVVGLRDRAGTPITGYGWMFPTGRGTVDVGVLLLSTSPSFQVLSPASVLDQFLDEHRSRWHLDDESVGPSTGGRIPLGRSVGPAAGPTWLLVGDAAGAADPWSGAGVGPALSTGAIAGSVLTEALHSGSSDALQRYPRRLDDLFEPGYGVGRLADRLLGQPAVASRFFAGAARSGAFGEAFLRLATDAVRPGVPGPAELAFRLGRGLGVLVPGL
jgi:geranylgeranyl reductase family protein